MTQILPPVSYTIIPNTTVIRDADGNSAVQGPNVINDARYYTKTDIDGIFGTVNEANGWVQLDGDGNIPVESIKIKYDTTQNLQNNVLPANEIATDRIDLYIGQLSGPPRVVGSRTRMEIDLGTGDGITLREFTLTHNQVETVYIKYSAFGDLAICHSIEAGTYLGQKLYLICEMTYDDAVDPTWGSIFFESSGTNEQFEVIQSLVGTAIYHATIIWNGTLWQLARNDAFAYFGQSYGEHEYAILNGWAVRIGHNCISSADHSFAAGGNAEATGNYSYASQLAKVSGSNGFGHGPIQSSRYSEQAWWHADEFSATTYNVRESNFGLSRKTTSATPLAIALAIIPASTTWTFEVRVSAISETTHKGVGYNFVGCISRDNANATVILGTVDKLTFEAATLTGCDAAITANDTTESLVLTVTGIAANTILWTAKVVKMIENSLNPLT